MVLGGPAAVIVGPVFRCRNVDLVCDALDGILFELLGSRKASLPGEEPQGDGETEARGPSLAGEHGELIRTEYPCLLQLLTRPSVLHTFARLRGTGSYFSWHRLSVVGDYTLERRQEPCSRVVRIVVDSA
jgi:hypothetical protein